MLDLVLYCKSYSEDLNRFLRLAESIEKYNIEKIEFYLSVPSKDFELFKDRTAQFDIILIQDELIIASNQKFKIDYIDKLPGKISQQIIKSEFWRLGFSANYVCLDSDNEFIKNFRKSDFICEDGTPYTVIGEGKDYLTYFASKKISKIQTYLNKEAKHVQDFIGRSGKIYDFGIPPLVWSKKVWESLDQFLCEKNMNFADAIIQYPYELRLYGEALLRFNAIPLRPSEPFFRTYLHEIQYYADKKRGITLDAIRKNYLGIVKQSNWDGIGYEIKKSFLSRINKKIKGAIRKFRA
ncbi:MAG: DUF6492 family protein [Rhodoferax sp.]|nr:DUF6492 family protein [Rhodoferax sp.]